MEAINLRKQNQHKEKAIAYFQKIWANDNSKAVYEDCISRSLVTKNPLPVWYLLMDGEEIAGCAGLIPNDFISAMDLMPWLVALYIEEEHRGKNYAALLIEAAKKDAVAADFTKLYVATDLIGYYEKFSFRHIGEGYHPWGESSRIYECEVLPNWLSGTLKVVGEVVEGMFG